LDLPYYKAARRCAGETGFHDFMSMTFSGCGGDVKKAPANGG
jgi:hypothetical protein